MKTRLEKKGWASNFTLVGKLVVNGNSFKLDQQSQKSDWVYSQANIGVACGDNGVIYCELTGGYGSNRANYIKVFTDQGIVDIPWKDRLNESILKTLPDIGVVRVFDKRFASPYDAIQYMSEACENGADVYVYGNIKYTEYNGVVRSRKEISMIRLAGNTEKPRASFTQSALLTRNCYRIDGDTAIIDGIVLEYLKKYRDKDVNCIVPLHQEFEFDLSKFPSDKRGMIMENLIVPVTENVTEIKYEGEFVSKGSTVKITYNDLSDDIKLALSLGVISEEEVFAKPVAGDGAVQRKMVIKSVKMKDFENEHGETKRKYDIIRSRYHEEDLLFDTTEVEDDIPEINFNEFDFAFAK